MFVCEKRQILKTNTDKVSVVDLFNEHIMSNECMGMKQGTMPALGVDWLGLPSESKKRKINDAESSEVKVKTFDAMTNGTKTLMAHISYDEDMEINNKLIEKNSQRCDTEYFDEEEAALARDLNDDEADFENADEFDDE